MKIKAFVLLPVLAAVVAITGCGDFFTSQGSSTLAATPTFSPAAGTYSAAQSVTISDTTSGAKIYYTTDGTNPTTSSSVYSSAISVSTSETLKAFAAATNYTNSYLATAAYTIGTTTNATTYYYIADSSTNTIYCYSLTKGVMTRVALSGNDFTHPVLSMLVAGGSSYNSYLYVGTADGIYLFDINSDGTLTAQIGADGNRGTPQTTGNILPVSMTMDTLNEWLLVSDQVSSSVLVYGVSQTNGHGYLNPTPTTQTAALATLPREVVLASDQFVYVADGTGGIYMYEFSLNSGAITAAGIVAPAATGGADLALALDSSNSHLYVSETQPSTIRIFSVGGASTQGVLTQIGTAGVATVATPGELTLDSSNTHLYVLTHTGTTAGSIEDFTVNSSATTPSGWLVELNNYTVGPVPGGLVFNSGASSLVEVDQSSSKDVNVFNVDSTTAGALDAGNSYSISGTATPTVMVATH